MHVLAVRRPGQRGTQKLVAQYGERLVCVRYRYDAASGMRYKTVELIVDQAAWIPPPPHPHAPKPAIKVDNIDDLETPSLQQVGVKVFFRENDLRERVKAAGGHWSKTEKLVAFALSNGHFPRPGTPDREALNGSIYGNMFTDIGTWS